MAPRVSLFSVGAAWPEYCSSKVPVRHSGGCSRMISFEFVIWFF